MIIGLARGRTMVLAFALAGTGIVLPGAAQAQDAEARLRKVESEIRALQRSVFPGGDGRYFTPEVLTPSQSGASPVGSPSSSAVTDILGRLDSMEAQLQRLTAQTEENTNAIAGLTSRMDVIDAARASAPVATVTTPTPTASSTPANAALTPTPAATPTPTVAAPSADRVAAVRAIVKPATADTGDDEYTYGFRLWEAKFYPEAQQQLRLFVEKNPKHWRATYARNLLGRSYLDEGKPREAAPWFLENYQADKAAERAPDSLLYLADTMITLKDTNRACLALAEFGEVYPAIASGRLQAQYKSATARVKCN